MNYRDYKNFAEGEYYHVFNRGVGKMDIFKNKDDYFAFIKRLKLILGFKDSKEKFLPIKNIPNGRASQIKPLPSGAFDLVAYCLMPNHFHFIIKQNGVLPVSNLILKLCTSYSMYFNKKYQRVGGLFPDAFKAINISENDYLLWLSAYIHQNPAVAGLVWDLNEWEWSSYQDFINQNKESICSRAIILDQFKKGNYKHYIETSFDLINKKKQDINSIFID